MGICFLGTYFSVSLLFYTILTSTVLIIPITYASFIPRPSTEGSGYTINERVIRSRAPTIPCEWRALSMRKGLKGGEGEGALQKFATCMQYDGITSNLAEIKI